jgi:DNA-binding CsgD family transcriptional regulator/tetratricopeptide (TPR) repeat protein
LGRSFLIAPSIGDVPIVGRQQELALLRDALQVKPALVMIAGDAGIGKSRLTHEAMAMARLSGFEVLAAACFPHDMSIAYAPFRELIRERHAPALDALLGADPARLSPAAVEGKRLEVFAAWRNWLETISADRPLLLCVEDLHWCDDVSLMLLADITLRPMGVPCILLVTFRDEALPALALWRASVDRSRRVLDITLGSLPESESVELLYNLFDDKNAPGIEVARALHDLADGYPFFLEELAKLVQGGTRKQQLPRSITDATNLRLKRLNTVARQLLDLAAVEGRDFDASFLGRILGIEERELSRGLRSLVDAGFIIERSAERFSFRHALLRVAVLDRQLVRETRDLHRRIARELTGSQSGDVDALARHWFGADAWEEALPYSLAAAEAAFALCAFRSAKQHWTRALQATARLGRPVPPAYQTSLGFVCELLEQFDDAHAAYEAGLALAREGDDALSEWQSLVSLGRLWTRRDYARAGVFFERAREAAARIEQPLVQAESANAMGSWLLNIGRDTEAVGMHQSVLPLLDADSHVGARARTLDRLGMSNGLAGRLSACVDAYDRAAELWRRLDNPRALAASLQGRAAFGLPLLAETVPWSGRSSSDCLADAMEAVRLAERARVPSEEAFARMGLACVHVARDEIGPALAEAEACRRIASRAGHDEWQVSARFVRALALLRIFAVEEAREILRTLLPDAERTGSAWWSINTRAYLAIACVQCHDAAGAEKVIEERAAALGSAAERRLDWARAELALLRRSGAAAGAIVDALLRTPPGDAHAPIPQMLFVRGAALALERRFASAVRTLERAREAVAGSGGLGLTVRIEAALARLHTMQNRRDRAEDAIARANTARGELLRRAAEVGRNVECGAQLDRVLAPPGRVALRRLEADRFSGLTRREREIAEMIGSGNTNGDVASSLGVSRRTIETHVENILSKLGVKSRVEIAVWASKNLG